MLTSFRVGRQGQGFLKLLKLFVCKVQIKFTLRQNKLSSFSSSRTGFSLWWNKDDFQNFPGIFRESPTFQKVQAFLIRILLLAVVKRAVCVVEADSKFVSQGVHTSQIQRQTSHRVVRRRLARRRNYDRWRHRRRDVMRDVIAGIAAAVVPRQYAVLASAGTETTFGSFRFTDTVSPYVLLH